MMWCDYCKAAKPGWIPVKTRLPKIDRSVLVCYPSGYDGSPLYAFGARVDTGDGWCWGIKQGYGGLDPAARAKSEVEIDDDYPVTHWMPLQRAPFKKIKKPTQSRDEGLPTAADVRGILKGA